MLTDGQVDNRKNVIELIRNNCSHKSEKNSSVRVFGFGVGDGVDRDLVEKSAQYGQGKSYFVSDSNKIELKSQVIDALQHASEPYLLGCEFKVVSK